MAMDAIVKMAIPAIITVPNIDNPNVAALVCGLGLSGGLWDGGVDGHVDGAGVADGLGVAGGAGVGVGAPTRVHTAVSVLLPVTVSWLPVSMVPFGNLQPPKV